MIEAYAFLAAFIAQILVGSVLIPARLVRYVRGWAGIYGSQRFAQLYPAADYARWVERFVTWVRAGALVVTGVGLLLLAWMTELTRQPGWATEVTKLGGMYCLLQMSPLIVLVAYALVRDRIGFGKFAQPPPETKRRAILQRRRVFDFVSPWLVILAGASYLLFIPFAIYCDLHIYQNASISRNCYEAIAVVTSVCALNAFAIYKQLYGKRNLLVTDEGRARSMGAAVKSGVFTSIAFTWFMVLLSFGTRLQLENWKPFAMTLFAVLLGFSSLGTPGRKPEADTAPQGRST